MLDAIVVVLRMLLATAVAILVCAVGAAAQSPRVATHVIVPNLASRLVSEVSPVSVPLELWATGVGPVVVYAFRAEGRAYLPVREMAQLLRLPYKTVDGHLEMTVSGRQVRFSSSDGVVVCDGETYVDAQQLGEVLRATVSVSWEELNITITNDTLLPAAQRNARALRRLWLQNSAAPNEDADSIEAPALSESAYGTVAVDYRVTFSNRGNTTISDIGINAGLLGGVLHGDLSSHWIPRTLVWMRSVGGGRFAAGMLPAMGLSGEPWRGIALSNVPVLRGGIYDTITIAGMTGPNWEVDIERDGELLAGDVASLDGRYAFRVPRPYGATPYTVVAYDPSGVMHRTTHFMVVRDELLPPHRAQYVIVAGQQRAHQGVRPGAEGRVLWSPVAGTTVAGGFTTVPRPAITELSAVVSVTSTLNIRGESRVGHRPSIAVQYMPSSNVSATFWRRDFVTTYALQSRLRTWQRQLRPTFFIDGTVRSRQVIQSASELRAGMTIQNRIGRFSPYLQRSQVTSQAHPVAAGGDCWLPMHRRATVRVRVSGVRVSRMHLREMQGVRQAEGSLFVRIPHLGHINVRAAWQHTNARPVLGWSFARIVPFAAFQSIGEGKVPSSYTIEGSLSTDPRTHRVVTSPSGASRSAWADAATMWPTMWW